MRLKLKSSHEHMKHFVLPPIRNFQPNRYTPRSKHNNRSLPKIPASIIEPTNDHSNLQRSRLPTQKTPLKDKLKAIHQKRKHIPPQLDDDISFAGRDIDEADLTSNFQKEIERNLMMIKKEKENQRKVVSNDKQRYESPRLPSNFSNSLADISKQQSRCATEEDVFAKINQIIIKSQSKSSQLLDERQPSYSASLMVQKKKEGTEGKKSKMVLKTQGYEAQRPPSFSNKRKKVGIDFKHVGNYNQWRKLSIDSDQNGKISYDISSYDMQTDRLERIRSKNDLSLRKYFEGKSYLSKLIKCRETSALLPRKP